MGDATAVLVSSTERSEIKQSFPRVGERLVEDFEIQGPPDLSVPAMT